MPEIGLMGDPMNIDVGREVGGYMLGDITASFGENCPRVCGVGGRMLGGEMGPLNSDRSRRRFGTFFGVARGTIIGSESGSVSEIGIGDLGGRAGRDLSEYEGLIGLLD